MQKTLKARCLILLLLFISACSPAQIAPTAINTPSPSPVPFTFTPLPSSTSTPTNTSTPTITHTPTSTSTPTVTPTQSITPSPTFDFPKVTVNKQAHCRYGPSVAYLHAADLYAGDKGEVRGRFEYSNWLQIKFDKLKYFCWVAASVVDVSGDITRVYKTEPDLLKVGYNNYGPPNNINAVRNGNQVTITWNKVTMTQDDDRGYFIEAWVCQNGAYLWWTVSFDKQNKTTYTVQDDAGCGEPSSGEIRTVEKHGYSKAVKIPWP